MTGLDLPRSRGAWSSLIGSGPEGKSRPSVARAAISHWASVGSFFWAQSA